MTSLAADPELGATKAMKRKMSFDEAVERMENTWIELAMESETGLELYALRNQALLGDNWDKEPSKKYSFLLERLQFKAWKNKRGITREIAQRRYVALCQDLLEFERVYKEVEEKLVPEITTDEHLEIHGLRTQAVMGDVRGKRPSNLRSTTYLEQQQWESWNSKKGLSQHFARTGYLQRVREYADKYGIPIDLPLERPVLLPENVHRHFHHHYHYNTEPNYEPVYEHIQ
ncbi:Acyl-CoA-binding protein-like protein [Aphelenchoides besseyi]|nr:Acyl-CoA-binding protein-like protein [Aphelenchoides besseyi]